MIIRVETQARGGHRDSRGDTLLKQAETLGVPVGDGGLNAIEVTDVVFLGGAQLDSDNVAPWVPALIQDTVVQDARWDLANAGPAPQENARLVEVTPLPGVTDSVAETLLTAAAELGFSELEQAATGRQYLLRGEISDRHLRRLATGLFANEVVERFAVDATLPAPFVAVVDTSAPAETVAVRGLDAEGLMAVSRERRLALDGAEMAAVQAHFEAAGRDPTDLELEMLAQTWSEHCVHKTFKATIELRETDADGVVTEHTVASLFKDYIKAATREADKPWLRSVFVDNAGIIAFDDEFDIAFKVETHNHPSALEPFGGANTGVGGVIRDILGVSARPIACTDVLCFGPPSLSPDQLPEGVLHPRRIADGVTAGIEDYGNKMGIPTVNGAIVYDPGYTANPLVYCGCLGVLPTGSHRTTPQVGDLVVCIGGRTGRDGLRGATFSSMEMGVETSDIASTSVQIGHPIHEKQALEVLIEARDAGLYSAVTDCGAGGLSSSIGEMAAELGAVVNLERAQLKYAGLGPWEIWLSEAQERMVFAVSPSDWPAFLALCQRHGVPCMDLGHFTGDGRLVVQHEGTVVGDLDVHFLHDGIPNRTMQATWQAPKQRAVSAPCPNDLTDALLSILKMPDVRSKEDVIRTYDHEVQGGTVARPLVGPLADGPGDACVLIPLDVQEHRERTGKASEVTEGVALSVGLCPQIGKIDPETMAWYAVDEAVRNAVAVGADPDHLALLDNFCWGNPNLPDRLGSLTLAARGCYKAAVAYDAPFISGKDSLNNEYRDADGEKHAIPGTLLISAVAKVPDVRHTAESAARGPGQALIAVGVSRDGLGGSAYAQSQGLEGGFLPARSESPLELMRAVHRVIRDGLCSSCHDCSEGGLAAAIAEMSLAGRVGATVDLSRAPGAEGVVRNDALVFGEAPSRFLMAVSPEDVDRVLATLGQTPAAEIGRTTEGQTFTVNVGDETVIDTDVATLVRAFKGHLAS